MTSERIEAIKTAITDGGAVYPKSTVAELLAALEEAQKPFYADRQYLKMEIKANELQRQLEEAQQQVEEQRDINEGVREIARDWHAEAKHWKTEHERSQGELVEAQQTIANAKRIFETADAETDFDIVLHGMYEALGGNKEGSDKT